MRNGSPLAFGRQLVSQMDAAVTANPEIPRSTFTGSFGWKSTFDAGLLIPFLVDEVLPGDSLSYDVTAYIRIATPLFPMMDSQRVDTHFFFVPNRLVWQNWQKFMGAQDNPGDSINFVVPFIDSPLGGFAAHSIYDQMGIPTTLNAGQGIRINALPLRAYNLIYDQWFRDQNLQGSTLPPTGDGPDIAGNYFLRRRAKSHDYFTSCLPWPQKFTAPNVPLSGTAPVLGIGTLTGTFPTANQAVFETNNFTTTPTYAWARAVDNVNVFIQGTSNAAGRPNIRADLSQTTGGFDINTFRQAFMIQELLERDARGGTRYTEIVRMHFGVQSPDMRLQRPEFIGGGSSALQITPIAQTAPSSGQAVGWLGGAGTSVGQHRASISATEHGYVIGLMSVKSELTYSQGLHKKWTRRTRYDFYWPSLAHLGEQAVRLEELYCTGDDFNDQIVFGFQERWHEYRTNVSQACGFFRSGIAGTLDGWHLGQRFTTNPTLGETFIGDNPPMARVLAAGAATNNQQYLADVLINRRATRPLPMYGTPVTLGRF